MSVFRRSNVPCPACQSPVAFDVVHSVNADRRPDLRKAVLDGSFQKATCESCKASFRLDPELSYLDVARNLWLAVHPASACRDWEALEDDAQALFDAAWGKNAPAVVRPLGEKLRPRVVFGWSAFREKVLIAEHGLSDVYVELLKGLVMSRGHGIVSGDTEIRLAEVGQEHLVLAWIRTADESLVEAVRLPRALYDEDIAADPATWRDLGAQLEAGPFVDIRRLIVETA
jgi:hypothetical protein